MGLFYNVKFVLQAMAKWPAKKTKEDSQNENPQFSTRTRARTGMDCSNGV